MAASCSAVGLADPESKGSCEEAGFEKAQCAGILGIDHRWLAFLTAVLVPKPAILPSA